MNQLTKSGTSIGVNYREANRAKSKKDFVYKIGIVEKEVSETVYWLELLNDPKVLNEQEKSQLSPFHKEAEELLALFSSIPRTARKNH